jgi:hypothetical protein
MVDRIFIWRVEKAINTSVQDCIAHSNSLFYSPVEREAYKKQLEILKELEQQIQTAKEKLIETTKH